MYVSTLLLSSDTPEEGIPVTDGCEPPCGCWELNSRPLGEKSVSYLSSPDEMYFKTKLWHPYCCMAD